MSRLWRACQWVRRQSDGATGPPDRRQPKGSRLQDAAAARS